MERQELLRLIDEAAADQRNELNLSGMGLTEIPEEICQLQSLARLDLSLNQISEIPKEIGELKNLTSLDLSHNQISEISKDIGELTNLTSLDFSYNQISEIPREIGELKNLTSLDFSYNQISEIPREIGELKSLNDLNLWGNLISEISQVFSELKSLTKLRLWQNQIVEIPNVIGELHNLTKLDLSRNRIREIPEVIGQLQNLIQLNLSENKISEIPEVIGRLHNLTEIDLSRNQIKWIPQWLASPPNLYCNLNGNSMVSLTGIGIGGFKSFKDLTKIKLSFLSILAGTNSSGKSSMIQPLLLMKQTIEANYDPGVLLLDGSHVSFTASEQFISVGVLNNNEPNKFQIFLASNNMDFQSNFQWSAETGLLHHSQKFTLKGQGLEEIVLREGMTSAELGEISLYKGDQLRDSLQVIRERCFLRVKGLTNYIVDSSLTQLLRSMIHVPGVRSNPERVYSTAATNGSTFTGLFEKYVVSIIDRFQKQEPEKLSQLQSHLKKLGLTDTIQTQRLNETQLELRVGRVPDSTDTVNIADVGFGVSQVLPVIVALLVAEQGQIVYIEQPEIHLHPRAQVALAEIFAEAINRGVQVIVETHSELFLLGIQTLVAENKIAPEDVQLHWFTRNPVDGSSTVTTAELDEAGAFGDWPEDFGSTALALQHRYISSAEKKLWGSTNNG
jgi:Leucine-rich repeat (LRR) protein